MSCVCSYIKHYNLKGRSPAELMAEYIKIVCDLLDRRQVSVTAEDLALRLNLAQVDVMLRALSMQGRLGDIDPVVIASLAHHLDLEVDHWGREKIMLRLQVMDDRVIERLNDPKRRVEAVAEVGDLLAGDFRAPSVTRHDCRADAVGRDDYLPDADEDDEDSQSPQL